MRRCARNDRYRKNDFFRLGGGIFEGGKQNPSDFASDSGKILMNGGNAEASAGHLYRRSRRGRDPPECEDRSCGRRGKSARRYGRFRR